MAFPQVATEAGGNEAVDDNSKDVTLPTGIQSGDLLLILMGIDGVPTGASVNIPSTWDRIPGAGNTAANRLDGFYKVADGTEGSTVTVTFAGGTNEMAAWRALRITGADPATPPESASGANTTTANPNPPLTTPSWGAEDTLWLVYTSYDNGTRTVTVYPANYTNGTNDRANNSAGVGVGVARRELNATSDNPGTFTISAADDARSVTLAIRPSSAATFERAAAIAATGAIVTSGTFWTVFTAAAAVAATGTVASAGQVTRVHQRSASLAATGQVAAVSERDLLRSTSLAASGAVESVPQRALLRSVAAAASGSIASAGLEVLSRTASVSATAQVATVGERDLLRTVGLAATGSVQTRGEIEGQVAEHERSVSVSATVGIVSAGEFWSIFQRAVAVQGTSSVATSGLFWSTLERSVAVSATGGVQGVGQRALLRRAALSATGTASVAYLRVLVRSVAVAAVGDIASVAAVPVWTYNTTAGASYGPSGGAHSYAGTATSTYAGTALWTYDEEPEFTYK